MVKFIDFSNDGYTRSNRRKASSNLKDTDQAKKRYEELVNVIRFGKSKLDLFTDKDYFGKIRLTLKMERTGIKHHLSTQNLI